MEATLVNFNFLPLASVLLLIVVSSCWVAISFYFYKKNPRVAFWIVCSLAFLFVYFSYCRLVDQAFTVEEDFEASFHDVLSKSKWPFLVDLMSVDGNDYIQLEVFPGVIQSMIRVTALRSGMPAYIFDLNGRMVDCTIDNNDDIRYQKKWYNPEERTRITIGAATDLVSQNQTTGDRPR